MIWHSGNLSYPLSGITPGPQGRYHEALTPWGIYKTEDRCITIGASWPRIARVVGEDWMIDEPRFKTAEDRVKYRDEINQTIENALSKAKAEQWLELFEVEEIPGDMVKSIDEAARDPQILARNMIISLGHPYGELKMVGNPIKMKDIKERDFKAPPLLGQHTNEVLSEVLGYSEEKISKLLQEAVKEEYIDKMQRHVLKKH